MKTSATSSPILEVRDLYKTYRLPRRQELKAVDGVSFSVMPGEVLGVVGESGCGKSSLGRCLLRLAPATSGQIVFERGDITHLPERTLRPLRQRMQMVFQDSYASLNPRRRIGDLLAEPLKVHPDAKGRKRSSAEITTRLHELMELVSLPITALARYPHEFSGGQRQRINIARALALSPRLIIADEPVSALDVSVQAQIINLFADLQKQLGLTYIFVAHDLAVVRQISNRVAVMYLGRIVEIGDTDSVLHTPAHPYTAALTAAIPRPVTGLARPVPLQGDVPSPINRPSGCRFHTRCPYVQTRCKQEDPALHAIHPNGHEVACHFPL
ncbi:ABC transporter ATP-binding protein [Acetobacter pasteurianus]|uniref:Macrolide export ATP-binding/permease protein MacB n=1 Tax=Acetobacter pasteurianus TaxID=438 RepID=A0A1A0DAK2_ACEPA|nr:ABC transporter ATP-binding protein [Acetobacter pasteurianus]OAZ72065.1 Macrolide export ATP-binding/permease protein MacB [Acetobacter pasteurianus]RCL05607.1 ABC transporter ATP-binding protein [Acetobacter pasteurianus]GAB31526.1 oligopeptide transporter ATP-binding protein OppF [Acetobacter pasteurianus subsp. pasteurianus LMG 1262 = NBRC 106471]GCD49823.1 oligopeptide transporter ATP-binding protein OppF [Acetobacter pasteurianus subsp. pasteurianus LMG 1262 = NBRC 106471]